MRKSEFVSYGWRTTALVALGGALVAGAAFDAWAKPPRPRAAAQERTERGVVDRFTTAPRGETDSAVLDTGAVIHWPPHVGEQVTNLIAKGDRIEVRGRDEKGPAGDEHFEAASITNLRSDKSLDVADVPPPGPAAPAERGPRETRAPDRGENKTIEGRVRRFTTAPRGEVDGAVLDDGAVIHWPPHLQSQFRSVAAEGDRVRAAGWMETSPGGDARLETRRLVNPETNASASNDEGPRPRKMERSTGGDLDARLQAMQDQIDRLQQELSRLRPER